jgi:membrane-bound serine protease (ClpP class)
MNAAVAVAGLVFSQARPFFAALLLLLAAANVVYAQGEAPAAAATSPGAWNALAHFVVSPWATIILLALGCLLLFVDLLTIHTWGVSGTFGVAAIAAVFAAHITVGDGGWIGVVLALAGVALLLLETHVFPGHGVSALAGLALLFAGMFYALGGSQNALFALSTSTVLTAASLIGFFAYLPRSPIWKQIGLQMQQRSSLGYVTSSDLTHFLGRTGRAATVLRPSGMAEIDGVRLDVVTEGEFLEAGTPLVVIQVEGSRVVVDDLAAANVSDEEAATRAA